MFKSVFMLKYISWKQKKPQTQCSYLQIFSSIHSCVNGLCHLMVLFMFILMHVISGTPWKARRTRPCRSTWSRRPQRWSGHHGIPRAQSRKRRHGSSWITCEWQCWEHNTPHHMTALGFYQHSWSLTSVITKALVLRQPSYYLVRDSPTSKRYQEQHWGYLLILVGRQNVCERLAFL